MRGDDDEHPANSSAVQRLVVNLARARDDVQRRMIATAIRIINT